MLLMQRLFYSLQFVVNECDDVIAAGLTISLSRTLFQSSDTLGLCSNARMPARGQAPCRHVGDGTVASTAL